MKSQRGNLDNLNFTNIPEVPWCLRKRLDEVRFEEKLKKTRVCMYIQGKNKTEENICLEKTEQAQNVLVTSLQWLHHVMKIQRLKCLS